MESRISGSGAEGGEDSVDGIGKEVKTNEKSRKKHYIKSSKQIAKEAKKEKKKVVSVEELRVKAYNVMSKLLSGETFYIPKGMTVKSMVEMAKFVMKSEELGEWSKSEDVPDTTWELLQEMSRLVVSAKNEGVLSSDSGADSGIGEVCEKVKL